MRLAAAIKSHARRKRLRYDIERFEVSIIDYDMILPNCLMVNIDEGWLRLGAGYVEPSLAAASAETRPEYQSAPSALRPNFTQTTNGI